MPDDTAGVSLLLAGLLALALVTMAAVAWWRRAPAPSCPWCGHDDDVGRDAKDPARMRCWTCGNTFAPPTK